LEGVFALSKANILGVLSLMNNTSATELPRVERTAAFRCYAVLNHDCVRNTRLGPLLYGSPPSAGAIAAATVRAHATGLGCLYCIFISAPLLSGYLFDDCCNIDVILQARCSMDYDQPQQQVDETGEAGVGGDCEEYGCVCM